MIKRELVLEAATCSADAIQRAAYRLSDRLSVDLITEDQEFRCVVHLVCDEEAEADAVLGELRNEILDQVLRQRIRDETEAARNLVLALAFSRTDLVDQEQG